MESNKKDSLLTACIVGPFFALPCWYLNYNYIEAIISSYIYRLNQTNDFHMFGYKNFFNFSTTMLIGFSIPLLISSVALFYKINNSNTKNLKQSFVKFIKYVSVVIFILLYIFDTEINLFLANKFNELHNNRFYQLIQFVINMFFVFGFPIMLTYGIIRLYHLLKDELSFNNSTLVNNLSKVLPLLLSIITLTTMLCGIVLKIINSI